MKHYPRYFLSLVFALLALGAGASLRAGFPQDESDLRVDPDVRFGELPNGLHYIILVNHNPEDRASLRLVVGAGSLDETDAQRGIAHFIQHLAFKGSTHYPPGTMAEELKKLGMPADPELIAETDFNFTQYMLELPDTRAVTLQEGCRIFADIAGGLDLRDDAIDQERNAILGEMLQRDSAAYRSQIAEMRFTLPAAIIPQRLPIGLGSVIEQAHRDRFVDFYDTWYRPERTTVIAVGDFDADAAESTIKEAFVNLTDRAPARAAPSLGDIPISADLKVSFRQEPQAPAATISIETITPYYHEADTAQKRLLDLRRSLAFAIFNRRLADLARQPNSPFASASADVGDQFDFVHNASIHLICKPERWQEALAAAEQDLRQAIEFGFQPAELAEMVANMHQGIEKAAQGASSRSSSRLADNLVRSVTQNQVFTSSAGNLALYGPALDYVTVQNCLDSFKDAWAAKGRYVFVSGNLTLPDPEATIRAAYNASTAVAVQAPAPYERVTFPYTYFGPPGDVVSHQQVDDLGITEMTFSNGVRLNLKKTDFEPGRINIAVRIGGGRLTEPAQTEPGLAELTDGIFVAGGLGRLGMDDLQRSLQGKTVGIDFKTIDDAFTFSGATDAPSLISELQLITAYITDPGYRPEALASARQGIPDMYQHLAHSAEGVLEMRIMPLLYSGNPHFGAPPMQALMARNFDEMKAWLGPQFAHGAIEVSIVGDFNQGSVIAAVARTLGALPAREPKPAYTAERQVAFPSAPIANVYTEQMNTQKTVVLVVWPTTDGRDPKMTYQLGLLASVMSSRLRAKIHGDPTTGDAPSARSTPSTSYPGYGTLIVTASTTLDQSDATTLTVLGVAQELMKNGVGDDELDRAKQSALAAVDESLRSNNYWLASVLSDAQEEPRRLDWTRTRADDIKAVTSADLGRLAALYLDPARASKFMISPAPVTANAPQGESLLNPLANPAAPAPAAP